MADPLTVVVLIVAGHAQDATKQALVRAVDDAIGPSVVVEVRETPTEPDNDEAVGLEHSAHAIALAELELEDVATHRMRLRVHLAESGRWIERQVIFGAADADAERGRALGYAVATMVPYRATEAFSLAGPRAPTPSPPPPPPPPPPAAQPPLPPPPTRATAPSSDPSVPLATSAEVKESNRSLIEGARVFSVDVVAVGAAGFTGDSVDEIGGGVAAQWFLYPHIALRLGLTMRGGSVEAANGTTLSIAGSAGLAWHPWRTGRGKPFGLGVRVDWLVLDESLKHYPTGPQDSQDSDARPVTAVDALVDAYIRVAGGVAWVVGLGIENDFGQTRVEFSGMQVATIPALHGIAESGIRLEF